MLSKVIGEKVIKTVWLITDDSLLVQVSSIVFEDFFTDVGAWNEFSIQLLEYLFTDLRKITIVCSYQKWDVWFLFWTS